MHKNPAITKENRVLYLSRGKYKDRDTWHYVYVDRLKLPLLLAEAKRGEIDLIDYGQILFSGFGKEPPPEVIDHIKKYYN